MNGLAQTMRDNTDGTHLPLPVNDTDLDHRYCQKVIDLKASLAKLFCDVRSIASIKLEVTISSKIVSTTVCEYHLGGMFALK